MTRYCVVEKPCPDCDQRGFMRLISSEPEGYPVEYDINCGRCFATGWVEEYRYIDGEDGSQCPVEIPDPPSPKGAGGRNVDHRVPVGAV